MSAHDELNADSILHYLISKEIHIINIRWFDGSLNLIIVIPIQSSATITRATITRMPV